MNRSEAVRVAINDIYVDRIGHEWKVIRRTDRTVVMERTVGGMKVRRCAAMEAINERRA